MNRREAIAALVSLPAVTRISVAQVKPNDVIVLECTTHITQAQADRLRAQLLEIWPDHKAIVLDPLLKLKIVEG